MREQIEGSPDSRPGRLVWLGLGLGAIAVTAVYVRRLSRRQDYGEFTYSDRHPALGQAALAGRDARVRVHEAITLNAPIERVEERWANLEPMPESLRNLGALTSSEDERAIVEFRPGPGGIGTEVRVEVEYSPRGGTIGAALARLLGGDPTGQLRQDLRHFKQIVETGEVLVSDGPSLWRAAQPAEGSDTVVGAVAGAGV
jgi:uncharacterized membrane protein